MNKVELFADRVYSLLANGGYLTPGMVPSFDWSADTLLNRAMKATMLSYFERQASSETGRELQSDPELVPVLSPTPLAAELLAQGLVNSAVLHMLLRGLPRTRDQFLALVRENMDQLRRGINEGTISTHHVIGFTGFVLPAGSRIDTPWGHLIPALDEDPISVARTTPRTTALLVSSIELQMMISGGSDQPYRITWEAEAIARAHSLLPLSILLAADTTEFVAPAMTWSTTLQRFMVAGGYEIPPATVRHDRVLSPLSEATLTAIADWSATLAERHVPSLDIAVRRVVSATSHRLDPADRLIDAAIAWESLFGARPETAFRLCAATTKFVDTNPARRAAHLKRLLKLYSLRSDIAHGADQDATSIGQGADAVVKLVLQCLAALYKDDSGLRGMKSSDRANALILLP